MSNHDRAVVLRQNLNALASEFAQLENLRSCVLKAEQRFGTTRHQGKRLVRKADSVRRRMNSQNLR
jgi:hypothetical protein